MSLAPLNADKYIYNDGELQGYYESIGNPDLEVGNNQSILILVLIYPYGIVAHYCRLLLSSKTSDLLYQVYSFHFRIFFYAE